MSAQPGDEETLVDMDPESDTHQCVKCKMTCHFSEGASKKGCGVQCRNCTNIYQIMYRHLGGMPDSWNGISPEDQSKFFKSTGSLIKSAGKNARWSLVKSALVTQLVEFHTQQQRTRISQEFLPLSVWKTRGFDCDKIQEKGQKKTCDVTCSRNLIVLKPFSAFIYLPVLLSSSWFGLFTFSRFILCVHSITFLLLCDFCLPISF